MTVDFTKSTYTVGGIHAELVRDLGEGDFPLVFDLYCEITRLWLAQAFTPEKGRLHFCSKDTISRCQFRHRETLDCLVARERKCIGGPSLVPRHDAST